MNVIRNNYYNSDVYMYSSVRGCLFKPERQLISPDQACPIIPGLMGSPTSWWIKYAWLILKIIKFFLFQLYNHFT